MRAAVFAGPGAGLEIEERPAPSPGRGQVLLRVGRAGICGSDLHMTSGHGGFTVPAGTIIGHEYAGEVVALGPEVTRLRIGDRVAPLPSGGCGRCAACLEGTPTWCTGSKPPPRFGGYAEYALADEAVSVLLPDVLTDEDGALVEPLAVALHGVDLAGLRPGATAAVLGAGPIGVAAGFWLKRLGARAVVTTDLSARRAPSAHALGADAFVVAGDGAAGGIADALGGPPDVVIDAAGAPGTIAEAIDLVRPRGTVVVLGMLTTPDTLVPMRGLMKQVRLQFSMTYGLRDFEHTVATLASGALEPRAMVTETVSFAQLPGTFEALRRPSDHCKVMIDPRA